MTHETFQLNHIIIQIYHNSATLSAAVSNLQTIDGRISYDWYRCAILISTVKPCAQYYFLLVYAIESPSLYVHTRISRDTLYRTLYVTYNTLCVDLHSLLRRNACGGVVYSL